MDPHELQQAMRIKASAGLYDQPDALTALKERANAGDPDAIARLSMLESLQTVKK